jgi:hypothetical protein
VSVNVSVPCRPAKSCEPFTATELMSRLNGMKKSGAKLQSTSAENWSIHVSVPTPTSEIQPVNVSVPWPVSRPVLQLIRLVKSANLHLQFSSSSSGMKP